MLKSFVKLSQNHKKVLVFPVSRSKVQILRRFSKKLRRRASSRPQLLEALSTGPLHWATLGHQVEPGQATFAAGESAKNWNGTD